MTGAPQLPKLKTERPILFSGPMVRAILDGRKTQTRRVIKPQPMGGVTPAFGPLYLGPDVDHDSTSYLVWQDDRQSYFKVPCPFGSPGDLLWVRETWAKPYAGDDGYIYRADGPEYLSLSRQKHQWGAGAGWKPSIHMPKVAARIWLRVTDVRVERVQEITAADALAEGIREVTKDGTVMKYCVYDRGDMSSVPWADMDRDPIDTFAALWDSLNDDRGYGFARNPWVWRIQFERTEAPRG